MKFDTEPVLHEGRIEAAYAAMARAAGIAVPETRLLEAAGGCHFFTRRFTVRFKARACTCTPTRV